MTEPTNAPETGREKNLMPRVRIATLCEQVLIEKDEVVSVIRVIDRVNLSAKPAVMPETVVHPTYCVSLVDLTADTEYKFELCLETPNGERKSLMMWPARVANSAMNALLVLRLNLTVRQHGRHWIVLLIEGQEITRTQLVVHYEPMAPERAPDPADSAAPR